jgi:hypothetical protein
VAFVEDILSSIFFLNCAIRSPSPLKLRALAVHNSATYVLTVTIGAMLAAGLSLSSAGGSSAAGISEISQPAPKAARAADDLSAIPDLTPVSPSAELPKKTESTVQLFQVKLRAAASSLKKAMFNWED